MKRCWILKTLCLNTPTNPTFYHHHPRLVIPSQHRHQPPLPRPTPRHAAILSALLRNCKDAARSLRFCNHFTFVSAIDLLACEGKERMWVGCEGEREGRSERGRQRWSQRTCDARLTYCHHDNRHHFTGAALRKDACVGWSDIVEGWH